MLPPEYGDALIAHLGDPVSWLLLLLGALIGYAVGGSLYDFISECWPYERKRKVWIAALVVFCTVAAFEMLIVSFWTL